MNAGKRFAGAQDFIGKVLRRNPAPARRDALQEREERTADRWRDPICGKL